jgi:hypothetical protein
MNIIIPQASLSFSQKAATFKICGSGRVKKEEWQSVQAT